MYAYAPNGIVTDITAALPDYHPALVAEYIKVPLSKEANIRRGWLYNGTSFSAPPEPVPVEIPIADVTASQAKVALFRAGYLPAVKAAVEAVGGEAQIWFETALTWRRNNPNVVSIGSSLMTESDMDDLFRAAALIVE